MRPLQGWRGKNEGKKVQGVRMNPDPGLTSPWSPSLSLSVHIARTRYVPLCECSCCKMHAITETQFDL
ncbi:hypothetical protein VFPFJ_08550 [Purpureocillium lilacinum]|uniref:Uncharacterized protein n=1 Tax=Purpureocillium lilacinum TaxID=33203 RepID=A0A179GXR0_PURLI|nr:hypothetical protein VFPFJ_08550 [Purpureocillium lilacinum]OAQ82747.1 hypothetical protein VFPFJ_08550 [Purpureocillium lilacinum]